MLLSITKDQLTAWEPCDLESRLKLFGRRESLSVEQALAAGVSLRDMLWVAGRLGLKRQSVQFALACARRAAHLNTGPRVQAALDATQNWLDAKGEGEAAWAAAEEASEAAEEKAQRALFLKIFKNAPQA